MSSHVLVSLFITIVLGDVVEVLSTDNDGSLHFCGHHNTGQDTASDGDGGRGERTLLVNVVALDGFSGGLEAESDVLVPSLGDLALFVLE